MFDVVDADLLALVVSETGGPVMDPNPVFILLQVV
jgi:hypothetical protein